MTMIMLENAKLYNTALCVIMCMRVCEIPGLTAKNPTDETHPDLQA